MNLLLVEDDEFKQNAITSVLNELKLSIKIICEKSVQAAIENITENIYDIILLDMALPSHTPVQGKGASVSMLSGGMEVIMELSYLRRPDKVIVLTQYSEIELDHTLYSLDEAQKKINEEFEIALISVIRFKREKDDWREPLTIGIREAINENFDR